MDKISAFVDGESAHADTLAVLKRLRSDDGSRRQINTFHLIGDVMRGDPVLRGDFVERLRARLDEEPTVLAPHARWRPSTPALYSAAAAIGTNQGNGRPRQVESVATGPVCFCRRPRPSCRSG